MLTCPALLFVYVTAAAEPRTAPPDVREKAWIATKDAFEEDCGKGEACTPDTPPYLVFDRPRRDPNGYDRLRTTFDTISSALPKGGLLPLRASGSSQFTSVGLGDIVRLLHHRHGIVPEQITVFDLRYEPHGQAGDHAVSWHIYNNHLNRDTPLSWALADETGRLDALARIEGTTMAHRICKMPGATVKQVFYHPESLAYDTTQTEQQVVERQGLQYVRLPMADHTGAPTDDAVERLIAYVHSRPDGAWWHLHCRKGVGRTTLFMAMLDMIANAADVPLDCIAARHIALSDVDILATSAYEPRKSEVRRRFAKAFHAFCAAGMPGRWRDWPRE